MQLTVNFNEKLAARVRDNEARLQEIIELGLQHLDEEGEPSFPGVSEMIEKLSTMSTPEEILSLKASPAMQDRIDKFLQKNREIGLSQEEQAEWDQFLNFEHILQMMKIAAARRLKETKST